jgi:hypothetical protein
MKWRLTHQLRNPLKSGRKREPAPEVPTPPKNVCPVCQSPARSSTDVIEGEIVLHCVRCGELWLKSDSRHERIKADDPGRIEKLTHIAEEQRRWTMFMEADNDGTMWSPLN